MQIVNAYYTYLMILKFTFKKGCYNLKVSLLTHYGKLLQKYHYKNYIPRNSFKSNSKLEINLYFFILCIKMAVISFAVNR